MDTWVVIPLYNEAAVIGGVVADVRRVFPQVLCVDDGCDDGAGALAAAAGAVVVRHGVNRGQGAALQTGLSYALAQPGVRYVVTFDADGQHQVGDAAAMVDRLRAGEADVVFASRFLDARTRMGVVKRLVLKAAVAYSNVTTGVRLSDAHNGLRAMTARAASALDLRQSRMAHASELIWQIGKGGFRYVEQPAHVLYTDYSRAKGQSLWNSVNILVELLYR